MTEAKFRKGDRVRFQFSIYPVTGEVKEVRGPIGVGGRHLYLVAFRFGSCPDELMEIELPAVKLQLLRDAVPAE